MDRVGIEPTFGFKLSLTEGHDSSVPNGKFSTHRHVSPSTPPTHNIFKSWSEIRTHGDSCLQNRCSRPLCHPGIYFPLNQWATSESNAVIPRCKLGGLTVFLVAQILISRERVELSELVSKTCCQNPLVRMSFHL